MSVESTLPGGLKKSVFGSQWKTEHDENLDLIDSHLIDTANPHSVTKSIVGLGDVENLRVNLDATAAPSVNDDSGSGYSVGSRWFDVTNDKEYVCLDASSGAAVWTETTGAISGEANTGSNVGTAGVGVFKAKSGVDLQFKNINAGSNKVTVTDDAGNNEIDIDVAEANIDHANIANTHNLTTDIDHDQLTNYDAAEHREINDAGTAATDLWSGQKIGNELSGKAASGHNHNLVDLTEKSYNSLTDKPTIPANHSDLTDDEAAKHRTINDAGTSATDLWSAQKIGNELGTKAASGHNHDGAYEPANANIQSHISSTSNPHSVTKAQVLTGNLIANADIGAAAAIALSKLATDPLARANHTGTQAASTISDFDTQVATTAALKGANADITSMTALTSITAAAADFILSQGGANVIKSEYSGAVVNTLYLKEGNVGIGVEPEAWRSLYTAIQIGGMCALSSKVSADAGNELFLTQNAYYDATNNRWEYIIADEATRYLQSDGEHIFYTAAIGASPDDPITWLKNLTIDSSGNINISGLTASQDVQTDASKNLTSVSDMTWKNDLGLIKSGLDIVMRLKPHYFTWKKDSRGSFVDPKQPRLAGFFSQEVYKDFPEGSPGGANVDKDGNEHWGLNSRAILAANTRAIQELKAELDAFKASAGSGAVTIN